MILSINTCETEVYSSQFQRYIARLQQLRAVEETPLGELFNNDYQSKIFYEPSIEDSPAKDIEIHAIIEEIRFN